MAKLANMQTEYRGTFKCPACREMIFATVQFVAKIKDAGVGHSSSGNTLNVSVTSEILGVRIDHNCLTEDAEGVS